MAALIGFVCFQDDAYVDAKANKSKLFLITYRFFSPSESLDLLFPGTQEITEPSEELRLSLVTLLTSVVAQSSGRISPYMNDLIIILQRTIVDPYPEVKKVLYSCVI